MCYTKVSKPWTPTGVALPPSAVADVPRPPGPIDISVEALQARVLELRSQCAEVEERILEKSSSAANSQPSGHISQWLRRQVDTLHATLEQKQRATQALRLRASFSQAHELRLEERQSLGRCVSLRRQLAAVDPSAAVVSTAEEARGPRALRQKKLNEQTTDAGSKRNGWSEVQQLTSSAAAEVYALYTKLEAALDDTTARQRDAERSEHEATSREAAEYVELERSIEAAKAELAKLREGQGSGAEDAALDRAISELQEEASKVREAKEALEADVAQLRRAAGTNGGV